MDEILITSYFKKNLKNKFLFQKNCQTFCPISKIFILSQIFIAVASIAHAVWRYGFLGASITQSLGLKPFQHFAFPRKISSSLSQNYTICPSRSHPCPLFKLISTSFNVQALSPNYTTLEIPLQFLFRGIYFPGKSAFVSLLPGTEMEFTETFVAFAERALISRRQLLQLKRRWNGLLSTSISPSFSPVSHSKPIPVPL